MVEGHPLPLDFVVVCGSHCDSPVFSAPVVVSDWKVVKWLPVDAAGFRLSCGAERFRVGIYDPRGGGGTALVCPYWVNTQQVAQLYGLCMLIKDAVRRKLPRVAML